jgi:hypothetical protein
VPDVQPSDAEPLGELPQQPLDYQLPEAELPSGAVEEHTDLPPKWLAPDEGNAVRNELHQLLKTDTYLLGSAYRLRIKYPDASSSELNKKPEASGITGFPTLYMGIQFIATRDLPGGSTNARKAGSNVRSLRRRTSDVATKDYLNSLVAKLDDVFADPAAGEVEEAELVADSSKLEKIAAHDLNSANGVYVYTYPHYWRYPYVEGSERRMLKVGRTENGAWFRVQKQARITGLPEDPQLLRVYVTGNPVADEAKFQKLLDAADHERGKGKYSGVEWFVTTVEFLDAIAEVLGLEIKMGSSSGE